MEKISADSVSFVHDIDCSNWFDHIEGLLDFPEHINNSNNNNNNNSGHRQNVFVGRRGDSFPPGVWNGSPFSPDSAFVGKGIGCSQNVAAELSIPYNDVVQMEWLEDSFSSGNSMTPLDKQHLPSTKDVAMPQVQFQLLSPISVLESSSSSTTTSSSNSCSDEGKVVPLSAYNNVSIRGGCGRARSKRPRPPTFNPGSAMQLISPAQSLTKNDNFSESHRVGKAKKEEGEGVPPCRWII